MRQSRPRNCKTTLVNVASQKLGQGPGVRINATRRLLTSVPEAKVLALSMHADQHFVGQMCLPRVRAATL